MPSKAGERAVSAVIIAQNEAPRIGNAIRSCKPFADEVLVVDGGSEDDTVGVAEALGARVLSNAWPGYAAQRNFAAEKAAHDWIFFLDADEVVGEDLSAALNRWKGDSAGDRGGYAIHRIGDFLGRWMGDEEIVRLYDRRRHRVNDAVLDEVIEVPEEELGKLEGTLWHYGFRSLREHEGRFARYTEMWAREACARGVRFSLLRLLFKPPARFLQRYILRGLWRRGVPGLGAAAYWFYFEVLRELKIYEVRWRGREGGEPPHEPPYKRT